MNRKQYLLTNIKSFLITLIPAFTMIYFSHLVLVFNSTLSHQYEMFNLITSLSLIALSLVLYSVYSFGLKREVPDVLNKIIKGGSFMLTGLLIWVVATNLVFFAAFPGIVGTYGAYFHSLTWTLVWMCVIVAVILAGVIKYFTNKTDEVTFNHQYRMVRNTGIFLAGSMLAVILLGEFGVIMWGAALDASFNITWEWSQTVIGVGPVDISLETWRINTIEVTNYTLTDDFKSVSGSWQSYLLMAIYFSVMIAIVQSFILGYFKVINIKTASKNDLPASNRRITQDWYLFFGAMMLGSMLIIYFLNEYLLFAQFADMTINGTSLSSVGPTTLIDVLVGSAIKPDYAGTVEGQLVTQSYTDFSAYIVGNYAYGTVMFWITNLLFVNMLIGMPFSYIKEHKITRKNWREHFVFGGHK